MTMGIILSGSNSSGTSSGSGIAGIPTTGISIEDELSITSVEDDEDVEEEDSFT